MFVHTGKEHLIINLATLILAGVIAHEVKFSGKGFLLIFFVVSILSVLPVLALSSSIFAGASAGIHGLFGAVAIKLRHYKVPVILTLSLFSVAIIVSSVVEFLVFPISKVAQQLAVHLIALSLGAVVFWRFEGSFFFLTRYPEQVTE